jgi:RimJ/RimL family protein N-acetyltransferase
MRVSSALPLVGGFPPQARSLIWASLSSTDGIGLNPLATFGQTSTVSLMRHLPLPATTDRLLIRDFAARDRDLEVAISDIPSLFDHLPIPARSNTLNPRSEAELDAYVQARLEHKTFEEVGGTVALVVETAEGGGYVGSMQLSPSVVEPLQLQIGWIALPEHQGKGLMTEAVTAVVDLVFDSLMAHRIVAEIVGGNAASMRLAERVGFRKEAHFVKSTFLKGEWRDEVVYSMLRDERIAARTNHV